NPDLQGGNSGSSLLSSTLTVSSPTITAAYEDSPKHYLTSNSYDYIIKGQNFEAWSAVGSTVSVAFTGGGASDITVTSITYTSSNQIRACIVIGNSVQPGASYNIVLTN